MASSGPAGNFILNVSTTPLQPAYSVTSGTVSSLFYLPFVTAGQCTTVGVGGKVTGVACGSGSANVAFTTGTSAGFAGIISSPTAVVVFDSRTTNGQLTGSSTYFFTLRTDSVTLQGNNLSGTYLTNSSASATYLQLSSATSNFLTQSSATATYFNKSNILSVADGGTGTSSPGLVAGTNIGSITGTWPNQTINGASTIVTSTAAVTAGHIAVFSGAASVIDGGAESADFILNSQTLQSGATYYVSSGTVKNYFSLGYLGGNQIPYNSNGNIIGSSNFTYDGASFGISKSAVFAEAKPLFINNSGGPADSTSVSFYFRNGGSDIGKITDSQQTVNGSDGGTLQFYPSNPVGTIASLPAITAQNDGTGNLVCLGNAGNYCSLATVVLNGTDYSANSFNPVSMVVPGNKQIGDLSEWRLQNGVLVSSITRWGEFVITPSTPAPYELITSTSLTPSTFFHVAVSTSGHLITNGPSPSVSSCGSGTPSVVGDDNEGIITVGGTAPTACTLTFASPWGGTPVCIITDNSLTISGDISSTTSTQMVIGFGVGGLAGGTVYYRCGCSGSTCR